MVRLLYILGVWLVLVGAVMFGFWLADRNRADPQLETILNCPSAVDRFRQDMDNKQGPDRTASPLVVQAEAFARYVNPPKSPDVPSAPALTASTASPVPPIHPAAPAAKFRLHGTSYYPNQPERSMALI
jgi:hypothetical protein